MADDAEFDAFVVARSPALLRTAYLLVRDQGLAEDLLQTSLTKTWFAWSRIHGDPEPYVRRVMVTTNVSWWRDVGTARCRPRTSRTCRPARRRRSTAGTCGRHWATCRGDSEPWSSCATTRT